MFLVQIQAAPLLIHFTDIPGKSVEDVPRAWALQLMRKKNGIYGDLLFLEICAPPHTPNQIMMPEDSESETFLANRMLQGADSLLRSQISLVG